MGFVRRNLERKVCHHIVHQDLGRAAVGVHLAFDDDDLANRQKARKLAPRSREQHQVDNALNVFDGDEAHRLAGLGLVWADVGDQPGYAHFLLMLGLRQLAGEIGDQLLEGGLVGGKRMVGDVQTNQFAFPVEHFAPVYMVHFGQLNVLGNAGSHAKERHLPGPRSLEMGVAGGYNAVECVQQGGAVAKGVQRADFDQAFQRTFAHCAQVGAAYKVIQASKGEVGARLEEEVNGALADIFDGAQSEANGGTAFLILDGKVPARDVDVGRKNRHAHAARFGHVQGHLGRVVARDGEQRGHVFGRVMGFQVGSLDRQHTIIGAVRFVEAVAGKLLPVGENLIGRFFGDAVGDCARDELAAMFLELFGNLLGDGFAQVIGFGGGIAA